MEGNNATSKYLMKEMNKLFGMKEAQINQYLNIYKLSKEITLTRKSSEQLDTTSLSGIGSEDDWSKKEKKEAIEILSKVEKSEAEKEKNMEFIFNVLGLKTKGQNKLLEDNKIKRISKKYDISKKDYKRI